MDRWLTEHAEPIIFAALAAWFAVTKWLMGKIYQRFEARMQAIETRQDDQDRQMSDTRETIDAKLMRLEDKIDAHYRIIDSKIDSILNHMMTRPRNSREDDRD